MTNKIQGSDLKVLLCLNGKDDKFRNLHNRQLTLLKYALESQGIAVTYDYESNYDIVHLLTMNQYYSYLRHVQKLKESTPLVFSLFNTEMKVKRKKKEDELRPLLREAEKRYKDLKDLVPAVLITVSKKESEIAAALDLGKSEIVIPGAKSYKREDYGDYEISAFRHYYRISEETKIITCYGSYAKEEVKNLKLLAQITPDVEFFYYGPISSNKLRSYHKYCREKGLSNLHFEGEMLEELYHSTLFSTDALLVLSPYHTDTAIITECIKAGVPVLALSNLMLNEFYESMYIPVYSDIYELYKGIVHLLFHQEKSKQMDGKELTSENYGRRLLQIYRNIIENQ